jgi:hypothetical protein
MVAPPNSLDNRRASVNMSLHDIFEFIWNYPIDLHMEVGGIGWWCLMVVAILWTVAMLVGLIRFVRDALQYMVVVARKFRVRVGPSNC